MCAINTLLGCKNRDILAHLRRMCKKKNVIDNIKSLINGESSEQIMNQEIAVVASLLKNSTIFNRVKDSLVDKEYIDAVYIASSQYGFKDGYHHISEHHISENYSVDIENINDGLCGVILLGIEESILYLATKCKKAIPFSVSNFHNTFEDL